MVPTDGRGNRRKERLKKELSNTAVKQGPVPAIRTERVFYGATYLFDQIRQREVDYGEANMLDENADVVRIMSIHKSKGLEFPVCIVAGTAKKHSFKTNDIRGSFLCDNDWGIGMDRWDGPTRTGKLLPQGAYVYQARCHHADGTTKTYTGTVLLLR